jgi:hypothetical protein
MASYDSTLQMWKSKGGQYFSTQSEAIAADQNYLDDGDFSMGQGGISAQAPDAAPRDTSGDQPNPNNPGGISDNELRRRRLALDDSATRTANINRVSDRSKGYSAPLGGNTMGGASGAYNAGSDASRANYDYMHELGTPQPVLSGRQLVNRLGEQAGISHAGDVANPWNSFDVSWTPEDLMMKDFQRATDPKTGLGQTLAGSDGNAGRPVARQAIQTARNTGGVTAAPGFAAPPGTSGPPAFDQGAGREGIDKETEDAKNRAGAVIEQNRDENAQLFAEAFKGYEDLQDSDYGLSDEARGYQREGLQQQRMLLEKMLGFDPNQYATQYADQALSRQIAAGRSAGGGAASQQAGVFAAMEQAPSLYAEGARQASQLQNQRLQMAETAAKSFGDLGTMTRGQDEQRAQYESQLGLSIADSVARLTEGNVQMNDRDSQQMAEIWMDFAKLQSVYAGMSSDEQLAWWQQETARRGQDKQFEAIVQQMKAAGKVSSKDLIGGLFQLGGGLISTGGSIGNAYMQGENAKEVARINAGLAA